MFEYTCPECGQITQVLRKPYKTTRCKACAQKAGVKTRRRNNEEHIGDCVFQPESIMCGERKCESCGWNPVVAKARLEAICGGEIPERKRNTGEWIAVTDGMPPAGEKVLALTTNGNVISTKQTGGTWTYSHAECIAYWMYIPPLPEV